MHEIYSSHLNGFVGWLFFFHSSKIIRFDMNVVYTLAACFQCAKIFCSAVKNAKKEPAKQSHNA